MGCCFEEGLLVVASSLERHAAPVTGCVVLVLLVLSLSS